jgi:hypothetical protein
LQQATTGAPTPSEHDGEGARGRPGAADVPTPIAAAPERPYGAVYALCVGINQYFSPQSGADLRFAEHDAESLSRVFTERYGYTVKLLNGQQATRANINDALNALIAQAGPDDVVIFYFAGHGATVLSSGGGAAGGVAGASGSVMEGYLLPQDIPLRAENVDDENIYRDKAINMRELAARLTGRDVKAKHVLLLLDCCASGMAVASRSGGAPLSREYVHEIASQPTRQVITAGKGDQKSYEIALDEAAGTGYGVFTHVLLGLLEKHNAQSILGMLPTLQQEVFDLVQAKFNARVIPQRKVLVDNGGDYVFIPAGANWRTDIEQTAGTGAARGYQPTSETEVEEVATAAKSAKSAPPDQSLENDPQWRKRANDLEIRAAGGDVRAMEALVNCYTHGLGVPKDEQRAFYWSTQAYEARDQRGSAMMAEFLKANRTSNVRNASAAPAAAAQVSASLPQEVRDAVAGYDLVRSLGSGGNGAAATSSSNVQKAEVATDLITSVWGKLSTSDKASFSTRLSAIEGELGKSRTDWDAVLKQLRGWANDIKAMEAGIPEKDRTSLQQLREHVDVLWRKARVHEKAELKSELDEAANAVRALGDVGSGK